MESGADVSASAPSPAVVVEIETIEPDDRKLCEHIDKTRAACKQAAYLRNQPKPRALVLQNTWTVDLDECIGELHHLEPAERERMTTCMLDASDRDELARC